MSWEDEISNPEDVHPGLRIEMESVVERVRVIEPDAALRYAGAGLTSVVLEIRDGRKRIALKVGRNGASFSTLEDEADFLSDANEVAALRGKLVPHFYEWHPDLGILEKEYVEGRPGGWGTRGLRAVFDEIVAEMKPLGWTAPEWKEENFIIQLDRHGEPTGRIVLIDVGFVQRRGDNLVEYIEDVLEGRRMQRESWRDLAWALRMDTQDGLVNPKESAALHAELEERAGQRLD